MSTRIESTTESIVDKLEGNVVPVSTRIASATPSIVANVAGNVVPVSTRIASATPSIVANVAGNVVPVSVRIESTTASTVSIFVSKGPRAAPYAFAIVALPFPLTPSDDLVYGVSGSTADGVIYPNVLIGEIYRGIAHG